MAAKTRNISTLIESQLPGFILQDYSKFKTFIEKYYEQQELRGQPLDIIHNITTYRNIDFYDKTILREKTTLSSSIVSSATTITVQDASSFPEENGYIKINDEICFYKERTDTEFLEVSRGVSGNTVLGDLYTKSEFVSTEAANHSVNSEVLNVSNLFLYAFVRNFEKEYLAAFPEKYLKDEVDKRTLIKNIGDFYKAKGTERSIQFLFNTLISREPDEVSVYNPKDYTLKSSTSDWYTDYTLSATVISGDPTNLIGNFITQDSARAVVDNVVLGGTKNGRQVVTLVLAPDTIEGEFKSAARTELRKSLQATAQKGNKVTVFSTEGFPQKGTVIIGTNKFTYSKKTVNQFTIETREATNTNYSYGTVLYNSVTASGVGVEFLVDSVVYNLLPQNPQPYAKTGDKIQVLRDGVDSSSPIIKNTNNENRWKVNSTYEGVNSIYSNISNQLTDVVADVSAIYEDDQYFYICSSSYPSVQELLTSSVTEDLQDQELLKLIRKNPITITEIYSVGNKDVGILVDGSPVYSNRSTKEIVYGQLESIKVTSKGKNYAIAPTVLVNEEQNKAYAILSGNTVGSIVITDDTLYEEDPTIRITSGENAKLRPIVTNGEITSILVDDPGRYYTSPPTIVIGDISGRGNFAEYEAIIDNFGQIKECVKISGGKLYDSQFTTAIALPAGSGATASASVRRWTYNRFRELQNKVDINNSYVFESYNGYGYGVVGNPKALRRRLNDSINGIYEETATIAHSPILGYAYDGNPIYGPYGYTNPLDATSAIVRLESGYNLNSNRPNGPSIITYPLGTFVDDYTWIPSINSEKTELDANNGRFCVTPDYPEGVYAYFVTIDADNVSQFPYILGENFYSLPVDSNYRTPINQKDLPANVKRLKSADFTSAGSSVTAEIKDVTSGFVSSAIVEDSFDTFAVGSKVYTKQAVDSTVSSLKGKDVVSIKSQETVVLDVSTVNTVYFFGGDTITQTETGATGIVLENASNTNRFILTDVSGEFSTDEVIQSDIKVLKFILDESSTYTVGSTVDLIDIDAEAIVASGEVLESTNRQNSLTVKVISGTFESGSNYYLKSNTLSDTSRSEIITITSLSDNIEIFQINDKVALLETTVPHGISVSDDVIVDINPDASTTETTFFVRKRIYQTLKTVPVSHNSIITDTGIGSGDVLTTGLSYISGTYENVELVFRDSTQARQGIGLPGDPGNARATIVVGNPSGSGFGPISSVTITNKGSGYRSQDILAIIESGGEITNIDPGSTQRFSFVVDHVGFAAENNVLYLSNVNNLSQGDYLQVGPEIVEITTVNLISKSVTVVRGRKGTTPVNHYAGNPVTLNEAPFRLNADYRPLGTGANQPYIFSYDQVTGDLIISYDYNDTLSLVNQLQNNSVFFDQSVPKKVVTLVDVTEPAYKLEISKGNENNFDVNPTLDVQKFYSYKFDTSHFSMTNTYLDISPSINYNILVDGKEVSTVEPGQPNSFVRIRFGFAPDVDPSEDPERIDLRYSIFYYFIKAFGVDTSGSKINIVNDPLTGKKKVTYVTPTKFIYNLDSTPEYDGSGEITYTTTSKSAIGSIDAISITNSSSSLLNLPIITSVRPASVFQPKLNVIISDGQIFNIVVGDAKRFSKPLVLIEGDGTGAAAVAYSNNNELVSVNVIKSGSGYTYADVTIVESDVTAYFKSTTIGRPKNVTVYESGFGFTDDYTITPKFSSKTVLVLSDIGNFRPAADVYQPFSGATAKLSDGGWKLGRNLLVVENVSGSFVVGQPITNGNQSAIVREVLVTDFTEELRSIKNIGRFATSKGFIGEDLNKIQDSYFYQDYSYVVESKTDIVEWRDLVLGTTHPAGFQLFGEKNIFSDNIVHMPEAVQGESESVTRIESFIQGIDTYTAKRVVTVSIIKFDDFNATTGQGAIAISDVDLTQTFFQDFYLTPDFDGDLDPNTGQRVGTDTFFMVARNGGLISAYNDEQIFVTLDGVIQEPGISYTTNGTQITFAEPPFGPRVAEGQDVPPQKFYGKHLRFISDTYNEQYFKKVKDISPEFDSIKTSFDLYWEDGSPTKTDENENLIVVIDGIKQRWGEAYTIERFEDPTTPDRILFTEKPRLQDEIYDNEDPREEDVVRVGAKCFIYSVGNYFTATIDTKQIPTRPYGPFNYTRQSFLTTDKTDNQKVINVPDPIYALVFVNNILQNPYTSYDIIGSLLTFKEQLPYEFLSDGTLVVPTVEIIYLFGRTEEATLTAYNFNPSNTYSRYITVNIDTPDREEFSWFYSSVLTDNIQSDQRRFSGNNIKTYVKTGESQVYGELVPVISNGGAGYWKNSGWFTDIPFFPQPTQTFNVTNGGVMGEFLIDGVAMPDLDLIAGNTYRFIISDPSVFGQSLIFTRQSEVPPNPQTFIVSTSNIDTNNFLVTGGDRQTSFVDQEDPNITIFEGDTIAFGNDLTFTNHPMFIRVAPNDVSVSNPPPVNEGTNFVSWTPGPGSAGVYYYQCGIHSNMLGTITVLDPAIANNIPLDGTYANVVRAGSGVEGFDYASVWLIIKPEALGQTFTYYDSIMGGGAITGSVNVIDGPEGGYGYPFVVTYAQQEDSADSFIGGAIDKFRYTPIPTGPDFTYNGFKPGDVLVNPDFVGSNADDLELLALESNGDGNVQITLTRPEPKTRYFYDESTKRTLGLVRSVLPSPDGSVRFEVTTNEIWSQETALDNRVITYTKIDPYTKQEYEFVFRGDYTLSYSEPQNGLGEKQLSIPQIPWFKKKSKEAFYKRTKALPFLHPGDEIIIDGETSRRRILDVPSTVESYEYEDGLITEKYFGNITTSQYNGNPASGQGLSIAALIDGNGTVTELIWNKPEWSAEATRYTTVKGYKAAPKLYFIPQTNAGYGAKAVVHFINGLFSIELLNGGIGYELPPVVVVAKGYTHYKNQNRVIDTVSVARLNTISIDTSVTSIIALINSVSDLTILSPELITIVQVEMSGDEELVITQNIWPDLVFVELQEEVVSKIERDIVTLLFEERAFETLDKNQFVLETTIENYENVSYVDNADDTEVNYQYQFVTTERFFGSVASGSVSDLFLPLESDFLIGDTILFVTNTQGIPTSGYLQVDYETVKYDSVETDRFFITERGSFGTVEADHFAPTFARYIDISVFVRDLDVEQAIETLFDEVYDVRTQKVERFITAFFEPEVADVTSIAHERTQVTLFLEPYEMVALERIDIEWLGADVVDVESESISIIVSLLLEDVSISNASRWILTSFTNEENLPVTYVPLGTDGTVASIDYQAQKIIRPFDYWDNIDQAFRYNNTRYIQAFEFNKIDLSDFTISFQPLVNWIRPEETEARIKDIEVLDIFTENLILEIDAGIRRITAEFQAGAVYTIPGLIVPIELEIFMGSPVSVQFSVDFIPFVIRTEREIKLPVNVFFRWTKVVKDDDALATFSGSSAKVPTEQSWPFADKISGATEIRSFAPIETVADVDPNPIGSAFIASQLRTATPTLEEDYLQITKVEDIDLLVEAIVYLRWTKIVKDDDARAPFIGSSVLEVEEFSKVRSELELDDINAGTGLTKNFDRGFITLILQPYSVADLQAVYFEGPESPETLTVYFAEPVFTGVTQLWRGSIIDSVQLVEKKYSLILRPDANPGATLGFDTKYTKIISPVENVTIVGGEFIYDIVDTLITDTDSKLVNLIEYDRFLDSVVLVEQKHTVIIRPEDLEVGTELSRSFDRGFITSIISPVENVTIVGAEFIYDGLDVVVVDVEDKSIITWRFDANVSAVDIESEQITLIIRPETVVYDISVTSDQSFRTKNVWNEIDYEIAKVTFNNRFEYQEQGIFNSQVSNLATRFHPSLELVNGEYVAKPGTVPVSSQESEINLIKNWWSGGSRDLQGGVMLYAQGDPTPTSLESPQAGTELTKNFDRGFITLILQPEALVNIEGVYFEGPESPETLTVYFVEPVFTGVTQLWRGSIIDSVKSAEYKYSRIYDKFYTNAGTGITKNFDRGFITSIINPVENVTIIGGEVFSDLVGPLLVDIEDKSIFTIRYETNAGTELQSNTRNQLHLPLIRVNGEYVVASKNPAEAVIWDETEVFQFRNWSFDTPSVSDLTKGNFWQRRELQPEPFVDSVIDIRTFILADQPINEAQGNFYAFALSPDSAEQFAVVAPTLEFDSDNNVWVRAIASTSITTVDQTEAFKYKYHWSGGSVTREGYVMRDPVTLEPWSLDTPLAGNETNVEFWRRKEDQIQRDYPDFEIVKEVTRFYPNEHLLDNGDPDPTEGFYGFATMSGQVFINLDEIPDPESPTPDPPLFVEFLNEVDVSIVNVEIETLDRYNTIRISYTDYTVRKDITRFYPNQHLLGDTPDPTEGFYGDTGMVSIVTNFNDYVKKSELPKTFFLEDPAVFTEFVSVNDGGIIAVKREIVRKEDIEIQNRLETVDFRYNNTRYFWLDEFIVTFETDKTETVVFHRNDKDLESLTLEAEVKRVSEFVTGIADSFVPDSKYLGTTLGMTFKMFQENAFVSNGSLNINGSLFELLGSEQIENFVSRLDSSLNVENEPFNLGFPSINELGTKLQSNLLIGETTITVSTVLDGPNSLWPTSGTLLIGNETNGNLEEVTYTGISGNTFTGVTRGVRSSEVDHIIPAEIPGDGIDQSIYVRTIG